MTRSNASWSTSSTSLSGFGESVAWIAAATSSASSGGCRCSARNARAISALCFRLPFGPAAYPVSWNQAASRRAVRSSSSSLAPLATSLVASTSARARPKLWKTSGLSGPAFRKIWNTCCAASRTIGASCFDITPPCSQAESGREIEGCLFVRADHRRVHGRADLEVPCGREHCQPETAARSRVPPRRVFRAEEHAAYVGEPEHSVAERKECGEPTQGDPELGIGDHRCIASEAVCVVPAERIAIDHSRQVEHRRQRAAAEEGRLEEGIRSPVLLAAHAQIEKDVGQQPPAEGG